MERCSAALTGNSVERSDRLTKPRATDIASAAEIISRIGVLFMKGAQRELVDVSELLQEMIVLPRTQAALPLQIAAPRRLTQFFCGIAGLFTSIHIRVSTGIARILKEAAVHGQSIFDACILGRAHGRNDHSSGQQLTAFVSAPAASAYPWAAIDRAGTSSSYEELKLTPEQQKQVRPLLQGHHDRFRRNSQEKQAACSACGRVARTTFFGPPELAPSCFSELPRTIPRRPNAEAVSVGAAHNRH